MKSRHKRLYLTTVALFLLSGFLFAILATLNQNISFFKTVKEAVGLPIDGQMIRIGGVIAPNTVTRNNDDTITFEMTDFENSIQIEYQGILPPLFMEGKAIVARGKKTKMGFFIADELLAKHDENYMPQKYHKMKP